jgi:hypothetical protein
MAIDVLDHYQREGVPFALMLRTYGITQIFTESDRHAGKLFENHLVDHLMPLGVDVIQVQAQGSSGLGDVLFHPALAGGLLSSRAPSLYLRTEVWLEAVTDLIDRAELIVVLLLMATGGVLQELEVIAAHGRADRTVVVCFGPWAQPNPLRESVLDQFQRVLHVGDLDPQAPISTFVFGDLVDRLTEIPSRPARPHRLSEVSLRRLLARHVPASPRPSVKCLGDAVRGLKLAVARGVIPRSTDEGEPGKSFEVEPVIRSHGLLHAMHAGSV